MSIHLENRLKDMVIRGGENLFPREDEWTQWTLRFHWLPAAQPLAYRWANEQTCAQNVVFLRGWIG